MNTSTLCTALAIIAITVIEIVNLCTMKIDGIMFTTTLMIIAGLGGYSVSKIKEILK